MKAYTNADTEISNIAAIQRTEKTFAVKIKEPIIVELYAELTPPRDPYALLFPHENS